jgi:hypothetical protein
VTEAHPHVKEEMLGDWSRRPSLAFAGTWRRQDIEPSPRREGRVAVGARRQLEPGRLEPGRLEPGRPTEEHDDIHPLGVDPG